MRKVKLGELGTFRNGLNFSKSDYTPNGVKFIGVGDFKNRTKPDYTHLNTVDSAIASFDDLLIDGDILFVRSNGNKNLVGRTLHISNLTEKTTYSGFCIRFRPNTLLVDSTFLFWMLRSPECIKQFTYSQQTNISNLSQSKLAQVELSLPSLSTQHLISSLLSDIDSKIETNGKIIAELESLARAVYDYWFTQFDFPDENGNPYRSSGGTMVHNDTLHRDIPEGWETGCLNDIAQIVSGATPPTSDPTNYCARGIAWITPDDLSNIGSRMYIRHGNRDISMQGLDSCSASLIPAGSVVMSSRAPIGYIAISENEFCTNQGCKSFISRKEYGKWYIYYTLQRSMPLIESQGSGTTFKEISKEVLGRIPIAIPPTALVRQYSDTVEKLCEQRKSIETESAKLTALRDWLLPLLMNGQAVID